MMDWLLQNTHPSVDWNYALITLLIRFIGVFLILFLIQIALQIASRSVRYFENRKTKRKTLAQEGGSQATDGSSEAIDTATIAAIGLALALENQRAQGKNSGVSRSAAWSIAGRMNQVRFR